MKRLLSIVFFCGIILEVIGCSKDTPKSNVVIAENDSTVVFKYLQQIRDSFCADSITLQYLRSLIHWESKDCRKCNKISDWTTFYSDSSDTCFQITAYLDSIENITIVSFTFSNKHWSASRFSSVFGKATIVNLKHKEYIPIKFDFGKNCISSIDVSGILDCDHNITDISLSLSSPKISTK